MRKVTVTLALTAVALLLHPLARAADACSGVRAGSNHLTVMSGGQKHDVDLVLPSSFSTSKRVPLVIGLHPSGGNGASFDEDTGLRTAATAKGFATIFPDGGIPADGSDGHYWNIPGVPLVSGAAVPADARDDIRFLADVIDHGVKNACVDARRVYVTGFSGGARMSSMVGCRLADRVTAVAPVAGLRAGRAAAPDFAEPDATDCRPARPLAVLALHGTDDPTNPFPGGGGVRWGYVDCRAGSEVVLYEINAPRDQGGGHVWPGGHRDLSTRATRGVGASAPQVAELDATQVVLEFFTRH